MAFEIDLLPVGSEKKSGDCIAMRYGDLDNGKDKQTVIVVDGGYANTWKDILKPHLEKYYKCVYNGKMHVDLVILSHPDGDHVSGLVEMAKDPEVEIGQVWMHKPWEELTPKWFKDGRITKESLKNRLGDAFEKAKELDDLSWTLSLKLLNVGTYPIKGGATMTILGPTKEFYKSCIANCEKTPNQSEKIENLPQSQGVKGIVRYESYTKGFIKWYDKEENTSPINESSFVLLFQYEGTKVLLTGDAGKEGLTQAIEYAADNNIRLDNCTIVKMPHHGSRKNINPKILDALKGSTYFFFSCASDDEGHHPSMRLINLMIEKGMKAYKTGGNTLHWGKNAPDRGWQTAAVYSSFQQIEK